MLQMALQTDDEMRHQSATCLWSQWWANSSRIWINSSSLIHSLARRVSWFMSIFSFSLEFSFSFLFSSLVIFILFSFFYSLLVLVLMNELVFFFVLVFVLVHKNNTGTNASQTSTSLKHHSLQQTVRYMLPVHQQAQLSLAIPLQSWEISRYNAE